MKNLNTNALENLKLDLENQVQGAERSEQSDLG